MGKQMFRYEVPVDDRAHLHELTCNPVKVAVKPGSWAMGELTLEFWAEYTGGPPMTRFFQVFGTGRPIPDDAVYFGTADRDLGLVWHLYEVYDFERQ